ncbi:uncharacterized protein G2W53_017989 [Senna tora]|uniref:Retrotransposon gag domain-containing protein n=1 Tax=Senna tora TaxID=362788 RepID=A0A834TV30_9FABA|nr:uncharacterized protein G2W53_017989 [Senna tora]
MQQGSMEMRNVGNFGKQNKASLLCWKRSWKVLKNVRNGNLLQGLANKDPYNHLKEFHVVCSNMKPDRKTEEQIKLRAFPFSLEDAAKKWLFYLPASSITSWEKMMKTFLERYYPASRVNNARKELFVIKQHSHETLFDFWERFKEVCASCPQHGIPEQALINFFYEGLLPSGRSSINGAAGGSLVEKSPTKAKRLIEIVASTSRQFG